MKNNGFEKNNEKKLGLAAQAAFETLIAYYHPDNKETGDEEMTKKIIEMRDNGEEVELCLQLEGHSEKINGPGADHNSVHSPRKLNKLNQAIKDQHPNEKNVSRVLATDPLNSHGSSKDVIRIPTDQTKEERALWLKKKEAIANFDRERSKNLIENQSSEPLLITKGSKENLTASFGKHTSNLQETDIVNPIKTSPIKTNEKIIESETSETKDFKLNPNTKTEPEGKEKVIVFTKPLLEQEIKNTLENKIKQLINLETKQTNVDKIKKYTDFMNEIKFSSNNVYGVAYRFMNELNHICDEQKADFKEKSKKLKGEVLENAKLFANKKINDNMLFMINLAEKMTERNFTEEAQEKFTKLTKSEYTSPEAIGKRKFDIITNEFKDRFDDLDKILEITLKNHFGWTREKTSGLINRNFIFRKKNGEIGFTIKINSIMNSLGLVAGKKEALRQALSQALDDEIKNELSNEFTTFQKQINQYRLNEFEKVLKIKYI